MNGFLKCTFDNCNSPFKNVYDFVSHFENIHFPTTDNKQFTEIEELVDSIRKCVDPKEAARLQEQLTNLYIHPIRPHVIFRLHPYKADYTPLPAKRQPPVLQFTNYRKRSAQHMPPPSTIPKKAAIKKTEEPDSKSLENGAEVKKFHCTVENCNRAYKNSAGLRNHMRSVHNIGSQQSNRANAAAAAAAAAVVPPSPTPAPRPTTPPPPMPPPPTPKAADPKIQLQYSKPQEESPPASAVVQPIGSLATFTSVPNRLATPDGPKTTLVPMTPAIRSGSRLTPSEENILNRNLTALPLSALSRPSLNVGPAPPTSISSSLSRLLDGKFKCDYCPKTYKTGANLRKHVAEHHTRQVTGDETEAPSPARAVLSKNVIRAPAYPPNPPPHPAPSAHPQQQGGSPAVPLTKGPPVQPQQYSGPSAVYHHSSPHQQVAQSSADDQSSLAVSSQGHAVSPRSYTASPVTLVVQPPQQQASPNVSSQQTPTATLVPDSHFQTATPPTPTARPPAARTFSTQPYYDRYQGQGQRRGANKAYATGPFYHQQKPVKQVYRQPLGHEYQRVMPNAGGQGGSRVNTIGGSGQPVRVSGLASPAGTSAAGSSHISGGSQLVASGASGSFPARANFEQPRRPPPAGASSLAAQLTPLNVASASQSGGNSMNVEGIQITKLSASQYNARSNVYRTGNQAAMRGRVSEGYRGAQPTAAYTAAGGQSRYNQQGMTQYPQRIMRVVQTQPPSFAHGNPSSSGQEGPIIQRVIQQPARARQESGDQ
ncbi:C2H2-type domain-containing protein [Aphelenchoides fujianensis]|nr:C2H2-type domain-containing protein [Aphelenchoides fujianensis]